MYVIEQEDHFYMIKTFEDIIKRTFIDMVETGYNVLGFLYM